MQIVINTIEGTFVVPKEREADLIYWLKHNTNRIDGSPVREQHNQPHVNSGQHYQNYSGTQLLNEGYIGN